VTDFEAVAAYAQTRLAPRGDVYAWAPLQGGAQPRAMLLISLGADPTSFPKTIGGVHIELRAVSAPEPHMHQASISAARGV
jgi:hypothetical protein